MSRYGMAVLLAAAAWTATASAYAVTVQVPPVLASQGVYTSAQARRGGGLYEDICLACHTLGRFRGVDFVTKWSNQPLAVLYKAVRAMPLGEPDSLAPEEYAEVVAYLLSTNGYPAGPRELSGTDAAMAAVTLDKKAP
jgi:S-disulfanyl-L-cysteine oxidoreductase SoxD